MIGLAILFALGFALADELRRRRGNREPPALGPPAAGGDAAARRRGAEPGAARGAGRAAARALCKAREARSAFASGRGPPYRQRPGATASEGDAASALAAVAAPSAVRPSQSATGPGSHAG